MALMVPMNIYERNVMVSKIAHTIFLVLFNVKNELGGTYLNTGR